MSEPNKQYTGDGQDSFADAARKTAEAAKQISQSAASKATAAGAEATANAAAATVKAGLEGGKAVAEIATGTAAGGPVGAIIAAAWAARHTLFKVLVTACLCLTFIIVMVVSLPTIVFNYIFRTDPATVDPAGSTDMFAVYEEMSATVAACVTAGYDSARAEVERIIADGGYDYTLSSEATIDYGRVSADYDVCYVLAAYSASMEQRGASKQDMKNKLDAVIAQMFPVIYESKTATVTIPAESEDAGPTTETVSYVQCTIHPFDSSVILTAFGIDPDAPYAPFNIRTGDAIESMATALKRTLYGTMANGTVPPLTDAELIEFLNGLTCSPARKELMRVALSLVGRVPYFWGGKSAPGWNDEWNTPKLVTSAGSSSTGTLRPYGLDCSGYTDWVYQTALGVSLYSGGTWSQWDTSEAITEAELLPGELGFLDAPGNVAINHVLLYAGTDGSGNKLWVHCSSSAGGVALNSPTYVKYYRRVKGVDLENMVVPTQTDNTLGG
ncbi:MAG: C40 family peptidase [Oscillospiraceae bacterium]|jgi:cell wall-associated NlpC family hydrolase|nr:C40 family peptidase [Oscillospiraceae bacterium]